MVKHINPKPSKPIYRQPVYRGTIYNQPMHQDHKTHVIKKTINVDQRNHSSVKQRDLPNKHYKAPRLIERNKVVVKEYPRTKDHRYVKKERVSERVVNRSVERNAQENDRSRYQERSPNKELNNRSSHRDMGLSNKERQPR